MEEVPPVESGGSHFDGNPVFLPLSETAMPAKRKQMNLDIVRSNLSEAIEELQRLERKAASGELNEGDFHVRLLHAYHHLNFAWNIRYETTEQYASLTEKQFKEWGRYPREIERL